MQHLLTSLPVANSSSSSTDTDITTTIHRTLTSTSYVTQTAPESITTSLSSTSGPWLPVLTYEWTQYIYPTVIGTVQVIVNTDTNRTMTSTKYNTQIATNGTESILTRTDTNEAGTVTGVAYGFSENYTV